MMFLTAAKMSLSVSLLLLISLLSLSLSAATPAADLAAELRRLRSISPSGVIRLTDLLVSRILSLSPSPLPFSLVVFFDARHLHSEHPDLNLGTHRSEFGVLSESFAVGRNPGGGNGKDLFFCDLEVRESQTSFSLFEVTSLPHIRLVLDGVADAKSEYVAVPPSDAETMAGFVESKTGVVIGPIRRPPLFSNRQKVVMACGFLILVVFTAKKVVSGESFLHGYQVWLAGAVFVYFFSVSGGMFNVIRKMPMLVPDRTDPSKITFFYQGSGMQLGAEAFAIGSLYTTVGLLIAFVTHGLVRVKNGNVQRLVMVLVMLVSFWAVKQVVFLDNWKTGYAIHMYWPTSWQ